MGGGRRRRSELRALKSAPSEGRKQDLSRIPLALRVWAISGSLQWAKQTTAALKRGSGKVGQELQATSPGLGSTEASELTWNKPCGGPLT